jgi:hypothetical protein
MAVIKETTNAGEDVGELESFHTVGGISISAATVEIMMRLFKKLKVELLRYRYCSSFPGHMC